MRRNFFLLIAMALILERARSAGQHLGFGNSEVSHVLPRQSYVFFGLS